MRSTDYQTEGQVSSHSDPSGGVYLVEQAVSMTPADFYRRMLLSGQLAEIQAHSRSNIDHSEAIRRRDEAYKLLEDAKTHVKYADYVDSQEFSKAVLSRVEKEMKKQREKAKNDFYEAEVNRRLEARLAEMEKEHVKPNVSANNSNTAT